MNVSWPFPVVWNVPAFVAHLVFLAFVDFTKGTRLLIAMQLVVPESSKAISGVCGSVLLPV